MRQKAGGRFHPSDRRLDFISQCARRHAGSPMRSRGATPPSPYQWLSDTSFRPMMQTMRPPMKIALAMENGSVPVNIP